MVTLVEINVSESQSPQEDRFQELVKAILDAIKQDGDLNEMTAEMYDQKKFDLIEQLTELSRLHKVLADQHVGSSDLSTLQLVKFCAPQDRTPIGYDVQLTPKSVKSTVGFILLSFLMKNISDLEEEIVSLNKKLQSSAEVITKLKDKIEEKESDMQSKQNYISTQKSRLEAEKAKMNNLHKQIAELKAVIADNNVRAEKLGEDVKKCKEKNKEVDEYLTGVLLEKVSEKVSYVEEISKLKSLKKKREDVWTAVIRKLKQDLKEKSESVDDLSEKFDALMLEKDGVNAQIETLLAEKSSQDGLIQELEMHLKLLQAVERVGVVPSFDNVEKLTNELKLKVAELETEVERQKNAI